MSPVQSPNILAQHLGTHSRSYRDPLQTLDWGALSMQDFWLPPEMLSLHGLEGFDAIPESTRRRLSQYEFLNFIYAGLWLEGIFIERLGGMLKRTRDVSVYAYYLHEIREEAGHSLMFLRLMEESGLRLPRPWRVSSLADVLGRHAPSRSALFWLAVALGEEIPDKFNCALRRGVGINPLIGQMAALHRIDEARHIAYARGVLRHELESMGRWRKKVLGVLAGVLIRQIVRICYLPSPQVYELSGLSPGKLWRERARNNPVRLRFVAQCVSPTVNLLRHHGVIVKGVEDATGTQD